MIVDVVRDDSQEVRDVIEKYHYLHRWPVPRSLPFAYRLLIDGTVQADDGRPHGVIVFKKLQHHRQKGLFGYPGLPSAWQILDMARVWIHPVWQVTGENNHSICMFTRMVSRVLRRVRHDWLYRHPPRFLDQPYHLELIISYCELSHHDGIAYKAASFESIGLTNDGRKEIYVHHLRPLRQRWHPKNWLDHGDVQLPLFDDVGIRYEQQKVKL